MNSPYKMTGQQAEERMQLYREIFTVVRLLDAGDLRLSGNNKGREYQTGKMEHCSCYEYWEKNEPCENCISRKVYQDRIQRTKLEYKGNELFEVTACFVEVDGKPCVMELVRRMDGELLIDAEGREKLLNRLTSYHDELYIDALTGAYNRRYYEDKIKASVQKGGIAMIDLDDFKLYNDTCGHDAGDAVLKTIVLMIRSCIRDADSLIRYGGDEFLLLMPDISREEFEEFLQRIKQKIHESEVPGYTQLNLSVSTGGVLMDGAETVEDAAIRADKLMYRAKNRKNMVVTAGSREETQQQGQAEEVQNNIKQQILIVDDSALNREILSNHWIEEAPVIMISSENSESYIRKAYELGVSDYISRPFDARVVFQRVFNTIKLYAKQRRLIRLVTNQIYEKEKNNRIMVAILSQIVEFRNGESGLHVSHINQLTNLLLERLVQKTKQYHFSRADRELIATASALHDIGKIGIDEKILNKQGKLTAEEFEIMKTHTLIGATMLKHMTVYQNEAIVKIACQICRWHHERYDGMGYPDGLKGEEIPIVAQVVSIVDVYDALVSPRVYKNAYSHDVAMRMILDGECGVFNPLLLECLEEIQDKIHVYYTPPHGPTRD